MPDINKQINEQIRAQNNMNAQSNIVPDEVELRAIIRNHIARIKELADYEKWDEISQHIARCKEVRAAIPNRAWDF